MTPPEVQKLMDVVRSCNNSNGQLVEINKMLVERLIALEMRVDLIQEALNAIIEVVDRILDANANVH